MLACSAVFSQDYIRNTGTYFKHSTGRSSRYFANAETTWVNKAYPWNVTWTLSYDTTLATGWIRVCVNEDTTKYIELRGSSGGGETFTTPVPELARFYRTKADSTNRPFRFFGR